MRRFVALVSLACAACGGGGSPTAPGTTSSSSGARATHPVSGVVFYDEDGDGLMGSIENVRMAGATVAIGGHTARADGDGRFTVDAEDGTQRTSVDATSLPPFFEAGTLPPVAVPTAAGFVLTLPVRLPIGGNRPHTYLAFGDSITAGDGSRSGGWPRALESMLAGRLGHAEVDVDAVAGTRSDQGAGRVGAALGRSSPAYLLVHYGTNDSNKTSCTEPSMCFTMEATRIMIREARAAGTLPVIATLIPWNPNDYRGEVRNDWIDEMNGLLRQVATEEGALLAPVHESFVAAAGGDLPSMFVDHVHPNDRGYDAMAEGFFRAITQPGPPHAARP